MTRNRRPRPPVVVSCLSCGWTAESSTWRPARRELAAHTARQHPKVAA